MFPAIDTQARLESGRGETERRLAAARRQNLLRHLARLDRHER